MSTEKAPAPTWLAPAKVTYMLILALLINAGSTVWWASAMNTRMEKVEAHVTDTKQQPQDITRLQEQFLAIKDTLTEIKVSVKDSLTEIKLLIRGSRSTPPYQ